MLHSITEELDSVSPVASLAPSSTFPRSASANNNRVSSRDTKKRLRKSEQSKKVEDSLKHKLQAYVKERENLEVSNL